MDYSKTTPTQLSRNGQVIGVGQLSVFGDMVELTLNSDGASLFLEQFPRGTFDFVDLDI